MMQHVYRSNIYERQVKSIINTDTALTLRQHRHHLCIEGVTCQNIETDPQLAQSQHYRKGCEGHKLCEESQETLVKDTRVWRHLETVINKADFAFKNVFF